MFGLEKCETSKHERQTINENQRRKKVSPDVDDECKKSDRYSKISRVITETFPNILRDIIRSVIPANLMYIKCLPHLKMFTYDHQVKLKDLQCSKSYSSLDITVIYRLLRQYSLADSPTKGWGSIPDKDNTKLGDDVERIRLYRNQIAHRYSTHIDKEEFNYYFGQFCNIGRRMDLYFSHETHYEAEIIGHKTCKMDMQMQTKYETTLKEQEHIQLRSDKRLIKFFGGNSLDNLLRNQRTILKDEKAEGRRKIRIQIIFQSVDCDDQTIHILNSLKAEINEGLSGIEFIGATLESTKPIPKKKRKDSESPFYVDLDIEANLLETDDKMVEELSNISEVVLKNSVENKTHQNISATLLPSVETGYMEKLL